MAGAMHDPDTGWHLPETAIGWKGGKKGGGGEGNKITTNKQKEHNNKSGYFCKSEVKQKGILYKNLFCNK